MVHPFGDVAKELAHFKAFLLGCVCTLRAAVALPAISSRWLSSIALA